MRIVRNSGYGHATIGGNINSSINQRFVYHVKIDHGTAEHGDKSVESYASIIVHFHDGHYLVRTAFIKN